MNLDELQSIRDRERQSDSLQQLRESFYEDAGELVAELRDEREAAAARADDPFDAPEVNRLTDDIKTAEQTVEAIYERRVGKLVKMASFAAADMPTEDEGLTTEERDLFENLVQSIERNREQVFDALDNTDSPTPDSGGESAGTQTPTEEQSGVGAADLMGSDGATDRQDASGSDTESGREHPPEATREQPPETPPQSADGDSKSGRSPDEAASDAASAPAQPAGDATGDESGEGRERRSDGGETDIDRSTVRITEDVGEIFCVDERQYDLSSEDVVTLPVQNATPLVERDAAERLD